MSYGRIVSIPSTEPIPKFCLPLISLNNPNITYCYTLNTSADLDTMTDMQHSVPILEEALIVIAIEAVKTIIDNPMDMVTLQGEVHEDRKH